jgi:hypothetical protein
VAPDDLDPAPHIGSEFRDAFATWADLRSFVAGRAQSPAFDVDRALHQLVMVDFTTRLYQVPGMNWMLFGSLALPARVAPTTALPASFRSGEADSVDPAYAMARSAFDIDLSVMDVDQDGSTTGQQYGQRMAAAVRAIAAPTAEPGSPVGIGLGGLVRYVVNDLTELPEGKVYGTVMAYPIDSRYGPLRAPTVDDPLAVELDLNPPKATTQPLEAPRRSLLGLDLPGLHPVQPGLYPTVDALADKVSALAGPPKTGRAQAPNWHRYKDLFDIHYLITACELDAEALRTAIARNPNMGRIGLDRLPTPYELFRESGRGGEAALPWAQEYEHLRQGSAQLRHYPKFDQLRRDVSTFVDSLASAPSGTLWQPGRGWTAKRARPLRRDRATTDEQLAAARSAVAEAARRVAAGQPIAIPASRRPDGYTQPPAQERG